MNFRKYLVVLAVFLLAVLVAVPGLSASNLTEGLSTKNMTQVLTSENVANVTNQTSDLENDVATRYFNYAQTQLSGCVPESCDYGGIIQLYDQALASNTTMLKKTDALLYLYQGKSYAQIQKAEYTDAVATVDAGLVVYPKDPMLWNNKGFALSNLGKPQDALTAYDKSISYNGNYTNALVNRGNLLNQMGRYSEAVSTFTRANETKPFDIAASEGLDAAKKGESGSNRTTMIIMAVVLIAAIGIAVWYVKFRKPADPAPEETKKKSRKK